MTTAERMTYVQGIITSAVGGGMDNRVVCPGGSTDWRWEMNLGTGPDAEDDWYLAFQGDMFACIRMERWYDALPSIDI